MCELKKIGKVFTSKFVGTGPSYYKKRICRAAVSQRLRNTAVSGSNSCLFCEPYKTHKYILWAKGFSMKVGDSYSNQWACG